MEKLDKGCSKPNYFLLWLCQQQPVLLVTVCLRPYISEGGKNLMSFLEVILLLVETCYYDVWSVLL